MEAKEEVVARGVDESATREAEEVTQARERTEKATGSGVHGATGR